MNFVYDQQTRYYSEVSELGKPKTWIEVSSVSSEALISTELKSKVVGTTMLAITVVGIADTMANPLLTANEIAEMATSVNSTATEHVGHIPGWHGLQRVERRRDAPRSGLMFEVFRTT